MQAEREVAVVGAEMDLLSKFDEMQTYNEQELKALLSEPDVVDVHVFKNTPENRDLAKLRTKYPKKNRQQLRKLLRKLKQ